MFFIYIHILMSSPSIYSYSSSKDYHPTANFSSLVLYPLQVLFKIAENYPLCQP